MTERRTERAGDPEARVAGGDLDLAVGLLAAGIGALAVAMPLVTGAIVSAWLGVLLVVLATVRAESLARRSSGRVGAVAAELLRATGYLDVGLLLVAVPLGPSRLSVLLAVPLLLDGVGRLVGVRGHEADRESSALLGVALVGIAALLLVSWPSDAAWVLGALFGAGLLLVGVVLALGPTGVRRVGPAAR